MEYCRTFEKSEMPEISGSRLTGGQCSRTVRMTKVKPLADNEDHEPDKAAEGAIFRREKKNESQICMND